MKKILLKCVTGWRQRHAAGDQGAQIECEQRLGANIHRRVRHMARTGRFVGELGEFAEKALYHLRANGNCTRPDLVREVSRLACVSMVTGQTGTDWETLSRPADATVTCAS